MSARKFTDEQAIAAINNKNNVTVRMVAIELKVNAFSGSNYALIKKIASKYHLDTSHWWDKSKIMKRAMIKTRVNASQYFHGKKTNSHAFKLKLIRDGYKKSECECCKQTEWMGQPIPLELHHIDGNKFNNKLVNLQILCANCHAQTSNYCSKNKFGYMDASEISRSE